WAKALRVTYKANRNRQTLEGHAPGEALAMYEALVGASGEPGLVTPEALLVSQAIIRVEYSPRAGRNVPSRDIRVTWPNACNLGQDQQDRVLREMLIASGLDPD